MTDNAPSVAVAHAGEGYVLLDGDGEVVAANAAATSMLGLEERAAGTSVSEFPLEVRTSLAGQGLPWDLDAGSADADADGGELEPIDIDVIPVETDGFSGHLLALRDWSGAGIGRQYRAILEASGDGVYTLDTEGCYRYTNRANTELLGYDDDEMIGMPVSEILDAEVIERIEDEIGRLLEEDGPPRTVVEHEVITKAGERVPVENHISLLVDDDGEFHGTAGVVRDVTERKAREERLERSERIIEAMADGVYAMDAEGRYTMVNDQMVELNGYDRETAIGAGPELVHDEADIERFQSAIRELLDARDEFRTVAATLRTASGEEVPIEVNLTLLTDADDEIRGSVGVVRDVSDRKERERELEQYETVVQTVPVGVAVIDETGTVLSANGMASSMLGYDQEEFVGSSLDRLAEEGVVDESVVDGYLDTVRELLTGEDDEVRFDFEATVDGRERIFEVQLAPRPFEDDFRGVVGTVEDVTEERERRQELERYETLLDVMPDTVTVNDMEGTTVEIHGFEGWSGYSLDDIEGVDTALTTPQEYVEKGREHVRRLLTEDDLEKVTYEQEVVTRDGERIPFENHLTLLPPDEDGMYPGTISVLRNITERRKHERALEALNATTRELVDAESREVVIEQAIATATGVLELPLVAVWLYDEDEGALVPASFPDDESLPDEPPTLRRGESLSWEVFEAGEPQVFADPGDLESVAIPDTPFRSLLAAPLGDHGVLASGSTDPDEFDEEDRNLAGILGAAVGTALDRLDREREREEQRRELSRKNEQLERFASVLSHDLRNPLNVAHARVRNAKRSGDTDRLESADEALSRMNELIEDLLTLAREGRVVGETEPLSLGDVADEAWRSIEAPEASLSVEDDAKVGADRARLCELLENLFRNAVEHAGPAVEVRVGFVDGGGTPHGFYVEDDGPGVPAHEREAVFERGVTGADDGTGYGLAIVREIAEAHGWTVSLTAGSDGGARFEFDLADSTGDGEGPAG